MTRLERRELLTSVCAAGVVATAGCLETSNGDADSGSNSLGDHRGVPEYVDYIPANSVNRDNGGQFAYTDLEQVDRYEQEHGPLDEQLANERLEDDTLIGLSEMAMELSLVGSFFGLLPYTFDDEFLDENFREMDGVMLVDATVVLFGEFDTDDVVEMTTGFERYGDHGDFEMYEGVDPNSHEQEGTLTTDTDGLAYAVSEDAIVASISDDIDGLDLIEEVTAAATGDRDTIADSHDSVDWALGAAGHGHLVLGVWDAEDTERSVEHSDDGEEIDPQDELSEDAGLMVSSLDVDTETVTGQFAVQFDEAIDDELEASLDEHVGQTADDRDRRTDDHRALVSGSWEL